MKVYIEYNITNSPAGGGNQFIRNIKSRLLRYDLWAPTADADIILYNCYHNADQVQRLKKIYPKKIFVHRLDGLMKIYNKPEDTRQDQTFAINSIANGSIFQSNWIRDKFIEYGFDSNRPHTVIINAADPILFFPNHCPKAKPLLVSTSISPNINKGFDDLLFLDNTLDFSKYNFVFIGNSPYKFKHIFMLPPIDTEEVGKVLSHADIFISGVTNDACSNSIIEALTCGLPVIAKNSGGNPELVKTGGELYNTQGELLSKIDIVQNNILSYRSRVSTPTLEQTFNNYLSFFETLLCTN